MEKCGKKLFRGKKMQKSITFVILNETKNFFGKKNSS